MQISVYRLVILQSICALVVSAKAIDSMDKTQILPPDSHEASILESTEPQPSLRGKASLRQRELQISTCYIFSTVNDGAYPTSSCSAVGFSCPTPSCCNTEIDAQNLAFGLCRLSPGFEIINNGGGSCPWQFSCCHT